MWKQSSNLLKTNNNMNLINFEFDLDERFEPTSITKKWGMYTHKSKHISAGMTLPGFFQTTNFTFHLIGFFSVFLLEGIAIAWSFEEGSGVAIILGLAFFDIFLAIMAHRKHADIALHRNIILYSKGPVKTKYEVELTSKINYRNFFYFLIVASALAKFYFFFSIYMVFDAISLLILFLYLLGGILHISCTGYAVFSLIFYRKINKDRSLFIKSGGNENRYDINKPFEHPIEVSDNVKLYPVIVDQLQRIIERDGVYYFQTNGILNDRQLRNMISNQQTDNSKRIVALEGIKHQKLIFDN